MGNNVSLDNPVVQDFALYSSVLLCKMVAMAPITAYKRMKAGAFSSTEDVKAFTKVFASNEMALKTDPGVERVRRAHQNDLENIPAFIFMSGLFLLTNPDPKWFNFLLKTYTTARIAHTFSYAFCEVPQPARALCFIVGEITTFYMGYRVITHFL